MAKKILAALLFFLFYTNALSFAALNLTVEEQQWLDKHQVLTYGTDNDFPPFEFEGTDGKTTGINPAYLKLIEKELGIQFLYKVDKWSAIIKQLQTGEVDLVVASITPERQKTMLFTREFISVPSAIIVRTDNNTIKNKDDLTNLKISTVAGWAWNEDLKSAHPDLKLIAYPTMFEAFNAVAFGDVDATIQDLATSGYIIKKNKITTLKMVNIYDRSLDLHFSVKSTNPILENILEKAFLNIPKESIDTIYDEWIRLEPIPFYQNKDFIRASVVILIIVMSIIAWSVVLKTQVQKRTKDLKAANDELESTIEMQRTLQRQLIDQEKMAALGSLVAGISHEVNAPLGIIKTAMSVLEQNMNAAITLFENKKLTQTLLKEHFDDSKESIEIMEHSIHKAIDIIQNMKTMSSDQMQENREFFNLCDYMNKIKGNLKYECKKKQVQLLIDCPGTIMIYSYPGIYSQIFTNLILNSIIHAFNQQDTGTIGIQLSTSETHLIIKYQDNGCGMDADSLTKMFDAFYTTRKATGGTGLGLYIVRTLITKQLGGEIECTSSIGNGINFVIKIPKESWTVE